MITRKTREYALQNRYHTNNKRCKSSVGIWSLFMVVDKQKSEMCALKLTFSKRPNYENGHLFKCRKCQFGRVKISVPPSMVDVSRPKKQASRPIPTTQDCPFYPNCSQSTFGATTFQRYRLHWINLLDCVLENRI
jgi:hypothetical protein